MTTSVVKEFRFEAAHMLPNHDGHCRDLHGHSYRVQVEVTGQPCVIRGAPDEGMVIDFARVAEVFNERVHQVVDHKFLNDALTVSPTTAENIAGWILKEMRNGGIEASAVRVWETATGYAEVQW